MHSEWSDGEPTLGEINAACQARGYAYAAITDHSHGLKIAGGMSMHSGSDKRSSTSDRDRISVMMFLSGMS